MSVAPAMGACASKPKSPQGVALGDARGDDTASVAEPTKLSAGDDATNPSSGGGENCADVVMDANHDTVGAVQARTWLESTRFHSLIVKMIANIALF